VNVLELLLGVDPALDADIPGSPGPSDLERIRHGHPGRRRQQSPHPIARTVRPKDGGRGDQGDRARGREKEGDHRRDDSAGQGKARRNLLAAWALM
jgi:hypothetical protein